MKTTTIKVGSCKTCPFSVVLQDKKTEEIADVFCICPEKDDNDPLNIFSSYVNRKRPSGCPLSKSSVKVELK